MTVTYESGRRIQAINSDVAGTPAGAGGWKELGRSTLSSTSQDLSVASLPDKRYYMVLSDCIRTVSGTEYIQPDFQFNGDTGNNYASRWCWNGGGEGTLVNYHTLHQGATTDEGAMFQVSNIVNLAGKEKMVIGHQGQPRTSGSGIAPARGTWVGKWANTSDAIHTINTWESGTGSYASGSETVILGWDEDDTHTDNFWEELYSNQLTTDNQNFDTGTITAKKYLWVQCFQTGMSGNGEVRFNSDSGTNYARRVSANGGTDATVTSETSAENALVGGTGHLTSFGNMFIINNSAREKFTISNTVYTTSSGAGNAPDRTEQSNKWANTSAQITSIQHTDSGTGFDTGSYLKVWGHD